MAVVVVRASSGGVGVVERTRKERLIMGILDYEVKGWATNIRGGLRVQLPSMKKVRHDGVRCYGEHMGKRCWPYGFSVHPPVPQSSGGLPKPPDNCRCAGGQLLGGMRSCCPVHQEQRFTKNRR